VKFTPPGGEVLLAVSIDKDGGLLLSVTDTGIGIGKEDLPKVMEPFGQVESALSHGASLALDSKLGRGTTALVSFPVERVVESSPTL
jgi:signal transduction histidine kinase